jgi:hypothetical protein
MGVVSTPLAVLCYDIRSRQRSRISTNRSELLCDGVFIGVVFFWVILRSVTFNILKPAGYGMHQQVENFNNLDFWGIF